MGIMIPWESLAHVGKLWEILLPLEHGAYQALPWEHWEIWLPWEHGAYQALPWEHWEILLPLEPGAYQALLTDFWVPVGALGNKVAASVGLIPRSGKSEYPSAVLKMVDQRS